MTTKSADTPTRFRKILLPIHYVVRAASFVAGAIRGVVKRGRQPAKPLSKREERKRRKELVRSSQPPHRRRAA